MQSRLQAGGAGEGRQLSPRYESEWLRRGHRAGGFGRLHQAMQRVSQADSGNQGFSRTCRAGTRDSGTPHPKGNGAESTLTVLLVD